MYEGKPNSPPARLLAAITPSDTSMTVDDGSKLPAAPNYCTIGTRPDTAETVLYAAKTGNVLSGMTRGVEGANAQAWPVGESVARNFNCIDYEAIRQNIQELQSINLSRTISAGQWAADGDKFKATISDVRIKAGMDIFVKLADDSLFEDWASAVIRGGEVSNGSFVLYASEQPTVNLPLAIRAEV